MYSNNSTYNIKASKNKDNINSNNGISSLEEKIEYIKRSIENGTYFVDSDKLALSLLENMPTLLESSKTEP